jgi:hypothetical protein
MYVVEPLGLLSREMDAPDSAHRETGVFDALQNTAGETTLDGVGLDNG